MVEYKLGYRYEVVKWFTDELEGRVCTYVGVWSDSWSTYHRFKLDDPFTDNEGDEFEYLYITKPTTDSLIQVKEISYFGIEKNYTI